MDTEEVGALPMGTQPVIGRAQTTTLAAALNS